MNIGRDSTQYVTPSPRCDPSVSQHRPGGFALQNAKSKITTTWSSRTQRVMATDSVRQSSSHRFAPGFGSPLYSDTLRWQAMCEVTYLNTLSQ